MNTFTEIISNGSKWAGEPLDTVDDLLRVLSECSLDRTFEDYGNFIMPEGEGIVHFWGNFFDISHVFSIRTDDAPTIERLTLAIRANQERSSYTSQHKPTPFHQTQAEQSRRIRASKRGK